MAVCAQSRHASTVSVLITVHAHRTVQGIIHPLRDDLHGALWLKSKEKHLQGQQLRGKGFIIKHVSK